MAKKKLHMRGLTSFFTLFGFLIMSITGLALYVVPAGRIAYWTDWSMLGLSKTSWGNIHILSSILFIVAGAFHIYFNWKVLINYFKDRITQTIKLRRELAMASIVSVWIIISALWPFPPLGYLLDFNEFIRDAWITQPENEPPFGHAELLSLAAFTKKMDIELEPAVRELKSRGIIFESPSETLEDIAIKNKISPMDIYMLIKKFEPPPVPAEVKNYTSEAVELEFAGMGLGSLTLAAMCERAGMDTSLAKQRLEAAGIKMGTGDGMKKTAENYELNSIDLLKIILIEGYMPER